MNPLYLSIISPLVELFPNYYLSWWYPPNKNIKEYNRYYYLRFLSVLLVWIPILYTLNKKFDIKLLTVLIFSAFITRETLNKESFIPTLLYIISLFLISSKLNSYLPTFFILLGASLISNYRFIDDELDRYGRFIFSFGFLLFIFILDSL